MSHVSESYHLGKNKEGFYRYLLVSVSDISLRLPQTLDNLSVGGKLFTVCTLLPLQIVDSQFTY